MHRMKRAKQRGHILQKKHTEPITLSGDVGREGCGSGLEAVDMKRSGGEGGWRPEQRKVASHA